MATNAFLHWIPQSVSLG